MWETVVGATVEWWSDPIGAVVGLGALILAGWNRWTVVRKIKRIADSQERVAEVEEAREKRELSAAQLANLDISFQRRDNSNVDDLVVLNRGPAMARGVMVEPFCERGEGPLAKGELAKMPFDVRAGQRLTFLAMFDNLCQPPVDTRVRWSDDAGAHDETRPVGR